MTYITPYLALTHEYVKVVNDDDVRKNSLCMNMTTPLHNLLGLFWVPVDGYKELTV